MDAKRYLIIKIDSLLYLELKFEISKLAFYLG